MIDDWCNINDYSNEEHNYSFHNITLPFLCHLEYRFQVIILRGHRETVCS